MLTEAQFDQRVRQLLTDTVPAATRRGWSEAELNTWWNSVATADGQLMAYRPSGDAPPLDAAIRACRGLIGEGAA
ncbi:hypothetical protein [Cupriavidus agavae]|uniref:Uncharacterized protein n=1 Tax=Cupriavidus agavae TaxID=1001822 RepID=A0A4Q7S877_9BURK|nr:hypothetical protein [Cupriavidus agavae]RZT42107.1 hypothetical protein EV147_1125 [Cupriavidus agavae]